MKEGRKVRDERWNGSKKEGMKEGRKKGKKEDMKDGRKRRRWTEDGRNDRRK